VSSLTSPKRDLWLRLKHYHFAHVVPPHLGDHVMACFGGPDAATRAFADKLQRKLGWTPRLARHAIEEYKKFLYLGVVADFEVTPSKIIDQVWHEHLLFTKAYREFCRDVLGRPFEHFPELVATEDQTSVFQDQFERTLDLYEVEFDVQPPADIWSTAKFDQGIARRRARRKKGEPHGSNSSRDDEPLYFFFDGSPAAGGESAQSMPEFGGGGGFSGGGGGDSWADGLADSLSGSQGDATGSSSDGDSGGGDSGGSDGGSGCSSGCGGGGCGGGGE
jgi:hypothetical protein